MSRSVQEASYHDTAVHAIARARFAFSDKPSWTTYTNHPQQQYYFTRSGSKLYPDIVVVDAGNATQRIAEVETAETVCANEVSEWAAYLSIHGSLYLYVPDGFGQKAKVLAGSLQGISFREYWFADGQLAWRDL